jgi:hypothetical protein
MPPVLARGTASADRRRDDCSRRRINDHRWRTKIMQEYLSAWGLATGFMPHGHCYLWTPALLWTVVVAEGIIVLSYFSIPLGLLYFVRQRKDFQFGLGPHVVLAVHLCLRHDAPDGHLDHLESRLLAGRRDQGGDGRGVAGDRRPALAPGSESAEAAEHEATGKCHQATRGRSRAPEPKPRPSWRAATRP